MISEFKAFIMRGNVVDLAVGIIMGSAFTAIVSSLVSDVIMPPLGWLMGGVDFSNFFFDMTAAKAAALGEATSNSFNTLKAAQDAGHVTINYGVFLNAIIKFMIVAFAVFMLVKGVNKLQKAPVKPEEKPAPTPTEVLLAEIRDALKHR